MLIVVLHLLYSYTPTSSFAGINSTHNRFAGVTAMLYPLGQWIRFTTDLLLCYWLFAELSVITVDKRPSFTKRGNNLGQRLPVFGMIAVLFSPEVVRGWNSKRDQCTDGERVESVVVLVWLLVFVPLDILNLCVFFTFLADSAVTCNVIKKLRCVSGDRFLNVACVSPSSSHSSG